jgi:tRNA pseudouridine55 synthase
MFGLLNLDKPPGLTSRDVVNRVQRLVKPDKAGHAGTLDPLATGVLVVAIGQATRLVEYVQRMPKTYRATFLLGRTSDTEDVEGQVTALSEAPIPTEMQIRGALPQFMGTIQQRPPAYSALKVAGERAHELARRGAAFELAPRPIEILRLDLVRYDYPEVELLVRCGSGTYIRSLGRDIALSLGTQAILQSLRREAIGPFRAVEALALEALSLRALQQRLMPTVMALGDMPRIEVSAQELRKLARGQSVENRWDSAATELAAVDEAGELIAIVVPAEHAGLRAEKCFVPQQ